MWTPTGIFICTKVNGAMSVGWLAFYQSPCWIERDIGVNGSELFCPNMHGFVTKCSTGEEANHTSLRIGIRAHSHRTDLHGTHKGCRYILGVPAWHPYS